MLRKRGSPRASDEAPSFARGAAPTGGTMSSRTRNLWIAAGCAFVIGGVAVVFRLFTGHRYADYGSYVPWGLWVGVYVYLVWLEVGTVLAFTGLVHVFRLKRLEPIRRHVLLLALALLVGALLQIGLDLGHLGRAWRALLAPNFSSPMAWMIWLHVIYLAVLGGEFLLALRRHPDRAAERRARHLSIVSFPLGLALISVVGSVFGVTAAQPLWSGVALPLFFLISSLVVGAAMVTLVYALVPPTGVPGEHPEMLRLLGRVVLGLVLFGAFSAVVNGATVLYPWASSSADALRDVLGGRHSWSLWLVHVALGVVVPVVILARDGSSPRMLSLAMILVVLGFIPLPLNLIVPPLAHPEFTTLREAYSGPGLDFSYFPSAVEWLVSLWIAAAVVLAILAGERWIARRPAMEH